MPSPIAQIQLSPAPQPQLNPVATYGAGVYGVSTYGAPTTSVAAYGLGSYGVNSYGTLISSGSSNVTLNVRARCANANDSGIVRVWLYEGSILREGPYDIQLTNSFTTYQHSVLNAAAIANWSNLNIQIQAIANVGSSVTAQVSWIDLESVAPAVGTYPKVGGGLSSAKAAGAEDHILIKTGGGVDYAEAGIVKTIIVAKTGGGIASSISGGSEAVTTIAQTYNESGGGIAHAVLGATKIILINKFGGGISKGVLGGRKLLQSIKNGGGVAQTISGALKIRRAIKTGGATTPSTSGGLHLLNKIHIGGASTYSISGGIKSETFAKSAGSISFVLAGGIKVYTNIYTYISKNGGVISASVAGAFKAFTVRKVGGGVIYPIAHGIYTSRSIRTGGSFVVAFSGSKQNNLWQKTAGSVSTAIGGSSYGRTTVVHSGGAESRSVAGSAKAVGLAKKAGSISYPLAGTTAKIVYIIIHYSTIGGGIVHSILGGQKRITFGKRGGLYSPLVGGGIRGLVIKKKGGLLTHSLAGSVRELVYYMNGGIVIPTKAGIFKNVTTSKVSGGKIIAVGGVAPAKAYVQVKVIGGSMSDMVAGGIFSHILMNTEGGGVIRIEAGGTKHPVYNFTVLGSKPRPILSTKLH